MKLKFLLILLSCTICVHAQDWEWRTATRAEIFAVDSAGEVFTWDGNTIRKYDPSGSKEWELPVTSDLRSPKIIATNEGDLYLAGEFNQISINSVKLTAKGMSDILVAKFSPSGRLCWLKTYGGSNADHLSDICLDPDQRLLLYGTYGTTGFFIARFDLSGNMETLAQNKDGVANEITTDTRGNIFITGDIELGIHFGNGRILKGSEPGAPGNSFMAKFSPAGKLLWAKDIGTSYYQPYKHLTTDGTGNLYATKWKRYGGFEVYKFNPEGLLVNSYLVRGTYGDCSSLLISRGHLWATGSISNEGIRTPDFLWSFDLSVDLKTTLNGESNGSQLAKDHAGNIYVSGQQSDASVAPANDRFFLAKLKW